MGSLVRHPPRAVFNNWDDHHDGEIGQIIKFERQSTKILRGLTLLNRYRYLWGQSLRKEAKAAMR